MKHMQAQIGVVSALLLLSGCRAVEHVEPSKAAEQVEVREPEPTPEPKQKPTPEPEQKPTAASWVAIDEPNYVEHEVVESSGNRSRLALENDLLRYRLDLVIHDEMTKVTLTERDTGHALVHEWSTTMCSFELQAGAALGEIAHDERGRKLLELWVGCKVGEDIISTEKLLLVVLVDAGGLSTLWSGHTVSNGSHVCAEYQYIEIELEQHELVVIENDRGEIYAPDEIPGYDCDENSRVFDTVRARHRMALP